jgi:hypothetical protein
MFYFQTSLPHFTYLLPFLNALRALMSVTPLQLDVYIKQLINLVIFRHCHLTGTILLSGQGTTYKIYNLFLILDA